MRSSGCVTARKIVVKLVAGCWKCAWVCDFNIELVDLCRVASSKVDLGSKKVGHHWNKFYR